MRRNDSDSHKMVKDEDALLMRLAAELAIRCTSTEILQPTERKQGCNNISRGRLLSCTGVGIVVVVLAILRGREALPVWWRRVNRVGSHRRLSISRVESAHAVAVVVRSRSREGRCTGDGTTHGTTFGVCPKHVVGRHHARGHGLHGHGAHNRRLRRLMSGGWRRRHLGLDE